MGIEFDKSNATLILPANTKMSFIKSTYMPKALSKAMHKSSQLVYEKGNIEILKLENGNHSVFIKFVDNDDDDSEFLMIYSPDDQTAVFWSELIDGNSEYGKTNIRNTFSNAKTFLYLGFSSIMLAIKDPYTLEPNNYKLFIPDSVPNYATALLSSEDNH